MNPRHRRLLIPGLLVVLVVIVVISSLINKVEAAEADVEGLVSTIRSGEITESSGLVVSQKHPDLVYTINDSGNASVIYAVQISTGDVVGRTTIEGDPWRDSEAMTIDHKGRLWVADTGDNRRSRSDVALYRLAEPGPGNHRVRAQRFPVAYPDGPEDVESLAANPKTGRLVLVTKDLVGGRILRFTEPLVENQVNRTSDLASAGIGLATDAAWSPDGKWLVVRGYVGAVVFETETFTKVDTLRLPITKQGETLAFEASGTTLLAGSEGANSPLYRVRFPIQSSPAQSSPAPSASTSAEAGGTGKIAPVAFGIGAGVLTVVALFLLRRGRA